MFTVYRHWFKNGNEDDELECTIKEFTTYEKAEKYAERYAKGVRFACYEICDNEGNTIKEYCAGE